MPAEGKRPREGPHPNERPEAPHPPEDNTDEDDFICDECKAVDWSSLPDLAAKGSIKREPYLSKPLRTVNATADQLNSSPCKVCRILSIIVPRSPNDKKRYSLRATPISVSVTGYQMYKKDMDATVLSVYCGDDCKYHRDRLCRRSRYLAVMRTRGDEYLYKVRRIRPDSIDLNELHALIDYCQNEHKKCCRDGSSDQLSGLQVIDTWTRTVIRAPFQCNYLALSYVWGERNNDGPVNDLIAPPPVIEDAIQLAISMDQRYLWVDRYCIPQDKDQYDERHRMISQMDRIYANAFLTIIAAAGNDAQTGLPGVTNLHRRRQREVRVRDVTLLELPDSNGDVYSSAWASRGWTYQECYLSTRRLIFTANEVLFLCNGICERESLKVPKPQNRNRAGFNHIIPQFNGSGRIFSTKSLTDHIQHYSTRKLSYDNDSLNAVLGVLNFYRRGSAKLTTRFLHLSWGLTTDQHSKRPHTWNVHLLWSHPNPTPRRNEFPSWSWTGWSGPVEFSGSVPLESGAKSEGNQPHPVFDWTVSFQMEDHSEVDITSFATNMLQRSRKGKGVSDQLWPRKLSISCLVLHGHSHRLELSEDEKGKNTKVSTSDGENHRTVSNNVRNDGVLVLHMWKGIDVCVEAYFDQRLEPNDSILGLLLKHERGTSSGCRVLPRLECLLVRPSDDGCYERVGLTELPPYTHGCNGVFLNTDENIMDEVVLPSLYPDAAEQMTVRIV